MRQVSLNQSKLIEISQNQAQLRKCKSSSCALDVCVYIVSQDTSVFSSTQDRIQHLNIVIKDVSSFIFQLIQSVIANN